MQMGELEQTRSSKRKCMKIKIKRFDKSLPMPSYKSSGAVGLDLCAREEVKILPHTVGYIPLNVAVEIPKDTFLLLAARSSTHKLGLLPVNGIGIGDHDFCGDNDEWKFAAYNFTDTKVIVEKGMRVAQMLVVNAPRLDIEEVDSLLSPDRGGFGSTGLK
jgi:dUTP pyrophosphatase